MPQDPRHTFASLGPETGAIVAAGGGGGKTGGSGSGPKEDRNSLRSRAYARVLYALCEGEIEGPATGDLLTSLRFDDTPVKRADGTSQFNGLSVEFAPGSSDQGYFQGFGSIDDIDQVGVKIMKVNGPVSRSFNDENADAVVVTLSTPQLQKVDSKGNVKGFTITFEIYVAYSNSGFELKVAGSFEGKCTGNYQRSYVIGLDSRVAAGPVTIRVVRTSNDSESNLESSDLYWNDFQTRIYSRLSYPYTAMLGVGVDSDQFKDFPRVSILLRGLKVRIPSNYNPSTRAYSGVWDGTWAYGWTNNPAWILFDMLAENRYGAGSRIPLASIDKWGFYSIAQYCDGIVPNGKGGWELRFTCNAHITTQSEAYDLLNSIASIFRGMVYWASGSVVATNDRPGNPVRLYSEANTVQETDKNGVVTKPSFVYSGSSAKARHTAAIVEYADPDDNYKIKSAIYVDRDGINRYGYRETRVQGFGCTSRSQAMRIGKWIIYSEQSEAESVTFSVASEGLLARPGELVYVADPNRAGSRMGGRVVGTNGSTTVDLDAPVTIGSGVNTFYWMGLGGNSESRQILNTPGTYTTITVSNYGAFGPLTGAPWIIETPTLKPQTFRAIGATESGDRAYEINAIAHNPSKFAAIENDAPLEDIPISNLPNYNQRPSPPSGIRVKESLFLSNTGSVLIRLDIGFNASLSVGVERYQIEARSIDDTVFRIIGSTYDLDYVWEGAPSGAIEIRVQAINKLGLVSEYNNFRFDVLGTSAPPPLVSDFNLTPVNDQVFLQWAESSSIAVRNGGQYRIRYTSDISATVGWQNSFELATAPGNTNSIYLPLYSGTYLIKAVTSGRTESIEAAIATTNYRSALRLNLVQEWEENPTFSGAKSGLAIVGGNLQLADNNFFDSRTGNFDSHSGLFDAVSASFDTTPGNFDSQTGNFDSLVEFYPIISSGIYQLATTVDLGGVYLSRITASMIATIVNQKNLFDWMSGNFDQSTGLFDGEGITEAAATLQISIAQQDMVFGPWQNFIVGDYKGRAFRFRLILESFNESVNILVSKIGITIDMPDRVESGKISTSAVGVGTVAYTNPFRVPPDLGISLISATQGDYYTIDSTSEFGFLVRAFNAAGTQVSRSIHWYAKGYGSYVAT